MFLPYLSGERTPHADPHARGAFVGLTLKHERGHLVRAVLEGVTFALRDSLAIMDELNVLLRQVRATGGGAKSPFWRQLQADILGVKVLTMTADEGPAYGVALLAAVGGGEYKNIVEACRATVSTKGETKPVTKSRRFYDQAFPIYQQLYQSLRDDFRALGSLT
jgi:xylulokinase